MSKRERGRAERKLHPLPAAGKIRGPDEVRFHPRRDFLERLLIESPIAVEKLRSLLPLYEANRNAPNLKIAIAAWCREFRFLEKGYPPRWMRQAAELSLLAWSRNPDARELVVPPASDLSLGEESCRILQYWDPGVENREIALERLVAELPLHMDRIEQAALQMGLQPVPEKRSPEHFGWLIRYLANDEHPERIAASGRPYTVTAVAVKAALREAAAL